MENVPRGQGLQGEDDEEEAVVIVSKKYPGGHWIQEFLVFST